MKSMANRKAIIVIGSGRSGTSLVMQVLNYLGVSPLGKLLKGDVSNPKGFFEDTRILEIHRRLLKSIQPHTSLPLLPGWLSSPEAAEAKAALIGHIHSKIDNKQTFAVKDPRTSLLIPLWREVLVSFSIEPVFVMSYRDPTMVFESMQKYNSKPDDWGQGLWDTRIVHSVVDTDCKFLPINYDHWFDSPTEVILALAKACGIRQNAKVNALIQQPDLIIKSDLKRSLNSSVYQQKVPSHSQKMYALIQAFQKNKDYCKDLLNYCVYFKEFYDSLVYVSSSFSKLESERNEGIKPSQLLEQIVAEREAILTTQKARKLEHKAFLASLEELRKNQGSLKTEIQGVSHQGQSLDGIATLLQQRLELEKTEGHKVSQLLEQIVADKEAILTTQKQRALEHEAFLASLEELRKNQGSLKAEIQSLSHQGSSLNKIINLLQKRFEHDREEEHKSSQLLEQLLNDKDVSLNALNQRTEEQSKMISTLQTGNINKDSEISFLQKEIERLNKQNTGIKTKNINYRERNKNYREKEKYHSARMAELRYRLTTTQKKLSALENQSVINKIFRK